MLRTTDGSNAASFSPCKPQFYLAKSLIVHFFVCRSEVCLRVRCFWWCTEHHISQAHNFFNLSKMSCASSSSCASVFSPPLLGRFLEGATGWSSTGMSTALRCWSIMFCASIIFCTGIFVRVRERIKSTGRAGKEKKRENIYQCENWVIGDVCQERFASKAKEK